jgi:plasmid stabilization system protein ParE
MPCRVELTRRAERDLEAIHDSINAADSAAAARWFNSLEETILSFEHAPPIGAPVPATSARRFVFRNQPHFYRIVYRANDAARFATVLEVVHGRRHRPPKADR